MSGAQTWGELYRYFKLVVRSRWNGLRWCLCEDCGDVKDIRRIGPGPDGTYVVVRECAACEERRFLAARCDALKPPLLPITAPTLMPYVEPDLNHSTVSGCGIYLRPSITSCYIVSSNSIITS